MRTRILAAALASTALAGPVVAQNPRPPAQLLNAPLPLSLNLGGGQTNNRQGAAGIDLFGAVQNGVNALYGMRGQTNGFASLDANGLLPTTQLPPVTLALPNGGAVTQIHLTAPGSTGDISGMSVTPQGSTTANTLAALFGRAVYITDFMTPGTTDITSALGLAEAKLGSTGGKILFPDSAAGYTQTAKHQFKSGIVAESDGRNAAVISTNFDGDIWAFGDGITTNDSSGARNITFRSTVTRTQGAAIALRGTYKFKGEDVTCDVSPFVCIDVYGGPNSFFNHIIRPHSENAYVGIRLGYGTQLPDIPADVLISQPLIAGSTRAGIEYINASGIQVREGDYILNQVAWLFDPGSNQKVAGVQTVGGFLDTSVGPGFQVSPTGTGQVADSTFDGLWSATSGRARGTFAAINAANVLIQGTPTTVRSLSFIGLRSLNAGGEGVRLEGGAYLDFVGSQIGFNGLANRGAISGVYVAAGVSNWGFSGGRSGAGTSFTEGNPQKYGIEIAPGTSDYFSIVGIDLTGNAIGSLSNGATGANQTIAALGSPYTLLGQNFGIGTANPFNPLTIVSPSRPYTDAAVGRAAMQLSTGTGSNGDNGIRWGVLDGQYAWMASSHPGVGALPMLINPTGGPVGLGNPIPATASDLPSIPVTTGQIADKSSPISGMAPSMIDGVSNKFCWNNNNTRYCVQGVPQ